MFAGMAIYNMIKRHGEKNKVKVYVDGLAGSIASVIAFAGTEPPEIPSNAFLMITSHGAQFRECGRNAKKWRTIWIKYRPES